MSQRLEQLRKLRDRVDEQIREERAAILARRREAEEEQQRIREWGRAQGYSIGKRGPVPAHVLRRYYAAHRTAAWSTHDAEVAL